MSVIAIKIAELVDREIKRNKGMKKECFICKSTIKLLMCDACYRKKLNQTKLNYLEYLKDNKRITILSYRQLKRELKQ